MWISDPLFLRHPFLQKMWAESMEAAYRLPMRNGSVYAMPMRNGSVYVPVPWHKAPQPLLSGTHFHGTVRTDADEDHPRPWKSANADDPHPQMRTIRIREPSASACRAATTVRCVGATVN